MRSSATSYELTDLQRQIWYGCLRFGDPAAYTLSVCLHIENVDPEAVRSAVERVLHEEPVLTLRVVGPPEEPVLETADAPPSVHSYRDMGSAGTEELESLNRERREIALDPAVSTFDSLLVRTGVEELRWFVAFHHIVADGWSVKVLVERVAAYYEHKTDRFLRTKDWGDSLNEWREYRDSPAYEDDERFWSERLAKPRRPTNFYGNSATRRPITRRTSTDLSADLSHRLSAAAGELGSGARPRVDLANFFAAVLFTYLYKLTGESTLSIGLPFSNRRSPHAQGVVGLFMQVAVLRVDVAKAATFRALLAQVAEESDRANRHVRLTPSNADNRYYDVMLNFHNVGYPRIGGSAVHEEWLRSGNDTLPFTLHVRTNDAARFRLEFDLQKGLFSDDIRPRRVPRPVAHFLRVLESAARNVDLPLADFELEHLPPLSPPPALQSIAQMVERPLHVLFAQQAAKSPERTAIVTEGGSTSFATLEANANRVRDELLSLGCSPGGIVGVRMDRSVGAIASILGVLKAGAIWLPLDPAYPPDLVSFMLSDSGARAIIQSPEQGAPPPMARTIPLLVVESESGMVLPGNGRSHRSPEQNRTRQIDRDNEKKADHFHPAFCLYTSGSTGRPKGVIGSHEAALNRLRWMWREFPFDDDEVVVQKTSLNFIDSVWEIFGALLGGRTLVVADDDAVRDPRGMATLARRYPIRRIILVPTLLHTLLEAPGGFPRELEGIRRWFVTGELFPSSLARSFLEAHPAAELFNLFGTTETYDAACHRVRPSDLDRRFIPIGRAIEKMQLYVLDARFRPVPVGVRGELFVGGVGVASGYLGRPDLTGAKFVKLFGEASFPLFRSGDSARILPGGEIELLGRLDNQIKLHGYRIELEEIEQRLRELPGISGAVALVNGISPRDGEDGRLMAYLTQAKGVHMSPRRIQALLREQVPPWMVPSVTIVDSLPTTPSGKRSHDLPHPLAEPTQSAVGESVVRRARAKDPIEDRLREIWRRVLQVEEIDEYDNFFDLGGNSLLAVRAVAQIERDLGIRLSLASLFEAPSIRQLIDGHIRGARGNGHSPVAIRRGAPHRLPLFSVPPAGSTVSAFGALARYLPKDQPLYSFQPKGLERGEAPHRTIEEMARDYLREMKAVQPQGPYLLSGRCFGGYVAYEMAQVLTAAGEGVAALIIIDSPEAPLEARYQRSHVGVRKLLRYYPRRILYYSQRRSLAYTVRMKLKNDFSYLAARLLERIPLPALHSRERRLGMLRRLHSLAYHRYVAEPYAGRITMLRAGETVDLTGEREKWEHLSRGGIDWHAIPGHHHDLMKEPNIREVAAKVAECLEAVRTSNGNRVGR